MPNRWWWVLLLLPGLARAAGELDTARALAKEMKYSQALEQVTKVLKDPRSGPEDMARAYEIQGSCLAAQNQEKKAVAAFGRLLAIEPSFRMPEDASPKLGMPFEAALGAFAKKKPIAISHQPPAAPAALAGLALKVVLESDPYGMVTGVRLVALGDKPLYAVARLKALGPVTVKVPDAVKGEELRYLVEAVNAHGAALFRLGSVVEPLVIRVRGAAAVAVAPDPILDAGSGAAGSEFPKKPETSPIATPPPKVGEGDPGAALAVTDETQQKEKEEKPRAWYQTWWFWTGVGVLTAGAVTGAVLATQSGGGSGTLRYDVVLQ